MQTASSVLPGSGEIQSHGSVRRRPADALFHCRYPTTSPSMKVTNVTSAFVSWNGATEVANWQLYGSDDASSPTPLCKFTKIGFETFLDLSTSHKPYKYYQVAGLDANGSELGRSDFVAVDGSTQSASQQGDKVTGTAAFSV